MKISELGTISSYRKYKLIIGLAINAMGLFAILKMWILN